MLDKQLVRKAHNVTKSMASTKDNVPDVRLDNNDQEEIQKVSNEFTDPVQPGIRFL